MTDNTMGKITRSKGQTTIKSTSGYIISQKQITMSGNEFERNRYLIWFDHYVGEIVDKSIKMAAMYILYSFSYVFTISNLILEPCSDNVLF